MGKYSRVEIYEEFEDGSLITGYATGEILQREHDTGSEKEVRHFRCAVQKFAHVDDVVGEPILDKGLLAKIESKAIDDLFEQAEQ